MVLSNIGSPGNCIDRFIAREKLISQLREGGNLTDSELAFAAKEFPELLLIMNPDTRVALAYVKEGNPLNAHTFPEKIWDDDEVLYQAFCNQRHLPLAALKRLNASIFQRFAEEHSEAEIGVFFSTRHNYLELAKKTIKSKKLKTRIDASCRMVSANDGADCLPENIHHEAFSEKESFSEIDLSGDIVLIKEKLPAPIYMDDDVHDDDSPYPRVVHYISDLHLTHKIKEKIDKGISAEKACKSVINKAVKDIENSIINSSSKQSNPWAPQVLVVCGDVSFDFDIAKEFYRKLSKAPAINAFNVYVVLGNHELWDSDPQGKQEHDCDKIIAKYREMLSSYGITLLENQVVSVILDYRFNFKEKYVIDRDFLLDESNKPALELLFSKSRYIICGGIGFSGYNDKFNADNGIYRKTIRTHEEEIWRSNEYDSVLRRTASLAKGNTVISLTHMPMEDWSQNPRYENCIYVSGHTHRNYRSETGIQVYADNQIGYKSNKYGTKQFVIDASYDIFESYPDGIHKIERIDYSEFGKGIGLDLKFRHDPYSQIYLLKRDGIYMFVSKSKNGLSILSGGRRKKLKNNDINYYYSKLPDYVSLLKSAFEGYEEYISSISKAIRELGGRGRIHGCIVDVDFFNHIYVNPYDGKPPSTMQKTYYLV